MKDDARAAARELAQVRHGDQSATYPKLPRVAGARLHRPGEVP